MKFELQNISGGYGKNLILQDLSVELNAGEIVTILGPNGCGKSTLLKIAGRLQKPFSGKVLLDGKELSAIPGKELAKRIAILSQSAEIPAGMTVEELVSLGRFPHRGESAQERKKQVAAALEATEITHLRYRIVTSLSGGERQRTRLAMTLAQAPELLLLDEPTANIDPGAEEKFYETLDQLRKQMTVITVSHDLGFVNRETDMVICVNRSVNMHKATDFTAETADEIYHHHVNIIKHDHACFCHCQKEHECHD